MLLLIRRGGGKTLLRQRAGFLGLPSMSSSNSGSRNASSYWAILARLRSKRAHRLPADRLLCLGGRRGGRLILVVKLEQLLSAFLRRCRRSRPEDLVIFVVEGQHGSRYAGRKSICIFIIAFLFRRSLVPLIPLLRMAPVREIILLGIGKWRRLLLAALLLYTLLLHSFGVEDSEALIIALAASACDIL